MFFLVLIFIKISFTTLNDEAFEERQFLSLSDGGKRLIKVGNVEKIVY